MKYKKKMCRGCVVICIMALICCSGCARDASIDNILDVNTVSAEHTASISAIIASPITSAEKTNQGVIIHYENKVSITEVLNVDGKTLKVSTRIDNTDKVLSNKQMKQLINNVVESDDTEELYDAYKNKTSCEQDFSSKDIKYHVSMDVRDQGDDETVVLIIEAQQNRKVGIF